MIPPLEKKLKNLPSRKWFLLDIPLARVKPFSFSSVWQVCGGPVLLALCLVSFSNLLREKILFHMTSHRLGMNRCEDVSVWKMGFSSLRHLILITNLLRGLKLNLSSSSPVNVVLLHLMLLILKRVSWLYCWVPCARVNSSAFVFYSLRVGGEY